MSPKAAQRCDVALLLAVALLGYSANLRLLPSGDTIPARLLPLSLLREGDLDLDEFGLIENFSQPVGPTYHRSVPDGGWRLVPGAEQAWTTGQLGPDGDLRVFALKGDQAFWEASYRPPAWSEWRRIPGSVLAAQNYPAAALDGAGNLHLFVQAKDWSIWENLEAGGTWRGWQPIPGSGQTPLTPAAFLDREGVLRLIIQGTDDSIYENRFAAGTWSGWRRLTRGRSSMPLGAAVDRNNRLYVFAADHQRRLHCWSEASPADGSGWRPLNHVSVAGFSATSLSGGDPVVIAFSEERRAYQLRLTNGSFSSRPLPAVDPLPDRLAYGIACAALPDSAGGLQLLASGSKAAPTRYHYSVQQHRGRLLSRYPVVLPLLITPLYVPALWLMESIPCAAYSDPGPRPALEDSLLIALMEKLSASLIAAASVALVYLVLRSFTGRLTALGLALLYGFGTSTWTISSQALWSHGLSQLALALMTYGLLRAREQENWLLVAGLAAALATANRPPNLVFALLALAYVFVRHRSGLLKFLAGPIPVAALLLGYNLYFFGSLAGGYGNLPETEASSLVQQLSKPELDGLLGILWSPNRGLFVFAPFTLFAFWGLALIWSRRGDPLLRAMSLGVLALIFFYGSFIQWWGGFCYGPRMLADILPFLTFLLIPVVPLLRNRWLLGLFVIACAWSVFVQAVGAFNYTGQWDVWALAVQRDESLIWAWHDNQILMSLRSGRAPTLYTDLVRAATQCLGL